MQPNGVVISMEEGRKLLRFNNDIGNMSTGVLEFYPGPIEGALCGDPVNPGRQVFQRIYQDTGGYGYYDRASDTEYRQEMVGCMIFHPAHNHWHITNFTLFELRDESGTVVRGNKNSTCMMDSHRGFELPGMPGNSYFLYTTCSQNTPQGISVGWVDRYEWNLPDQFVDITNVPDGTYCLVSTADPDGHMIELDKTNNVASLKVKITGATVETFPDEPCEGNNPPPMGYRPDPPSPVVYQDTLYWQDWSWNTAVDTQSTEQIYEGRWSIKATYNTPWAILGFGGANFNTTGYDYLQFFINANGQRLPSIYIQLTDTNDKPLQPVAISAYAQPTERGWYVVKIPLAHLMQYSGPIGQVQLQEAAGVPGATFYVDNLTFIPSDQ